MGQSSRASCWLAEPELETETEPADLAADDDGYSSDQSEAVEQTEVDEPAEASLSADDLNFDADTRRAIEASLREFAAANAKVLLCLGSGQEEIVSSWLAMYQMTCSCAQAKCVWPLWAQSPRMPPFLLQA